MAFGLWTGGYLEGNYFELLEKYSKANGPNDWRLVYVKKNELVEIKLKDVGKIVGSGFFMALRFWNRFRRFGVPGGDWRALKVAQIKVLELFETLYGEFEDRMRNPKGKPK